MKNNMEYMFNDDEKEQEDEFAEVAKPVKESSGTNKLSLNIID